MILTKKSVKRATETKIKKLCAKHKLKRETLMFHMSCAAHYYLGDEEINTMIKLMKSRPGAKK